MRWLLLLVVLSACAPELSTNDAVSSLATACNLACDSVSEAEILLKEGVTLYTTDEAVCLKEGNRLYCGTCSCDTYGPEPKEYLPTAKMQSVTCSFNGSSVSEMLDVRCSLDEKS